VPTLLKQRKSLVWLGLASGKSHAELAEEWHCSLHTVARVAGQGREQVAAMRARMIDQACGALAQGLITAARRLAYEADHAPEPRDRIAAARAILDKLVVLRPADSQAPGAPAALAQVPTEVLRRLVLTGPGGTLALEETVRSLPAGAGPEGGPGPPPFTGTPGPAAG
jgi:hypothetical protein